jgi:predicted esterase
MHSDDPLKTTHLRPAAPGLSRREFVTLVAAGSAGLLGCLSSSSKSGGNARLSARPGTPTGSAAPGLIRLGTGDVHDGYMYVPASYQSGIAYPLMLALHGAGGNVTGPLATWSPRAEQHGFLIVAVNSASQTWDGITGEFGTDVAIINTALTRAFDRVKVDPARIICQGFSDGASYGLAIGLNNGHLFTRIVANSPGFIPEPDTARVGKPEVFDSHGNSDPVLSINASNRIVSDLQGSGYSVTFLEFSGGHEIPAAVADATVTWMLR